MPPAAQKLRQAQALLAVGDGARAKSLLLPLARHADPQVDAALSHAFSLLAEFDAALHYARRAHTALPDHPALAHDYGRLLGAAGRHEDALPVLQRAVALDPRSPGPRFTMASVLLDRGDAAAAIAACAEARALGASSLELEELDGAAHLACGEPEAARAILERALAHAPEHPMLLSHLCCVMNYVPGADPHAITRLHRTYGALLDRDLPKLPLLPPPRDPGKRLTLGLVSSDLRNHSVSWFLAPLLVALDRSSFRVVCYHTGTAPDAMTARLRRLADGWRHVPLLPPSQLAGQLRADGVDIAVDLGGHTAGHRLAAFAVGAAPIQATWLGYPNTTGVSPIHLRIVDAVTDPPGSDALASERLLRLDGCFVCYGPPSGAPEPRLPDAGPIVLGCFATPLKVNDACLRLWAGLLGAVPGSRLLLKNRGLAYPGVRERMAARLRGAGIDPSRVDMTPWVEDTGGHLAHYQRVHVVLDTVPYCGTTTTCEALWMGVPVVTLAGETHASRVGASLLSAAGLADLVATTEHRFAEIAAELAADAGRLRSLREGLRERLRASPVCDASGFAARFGGALRAEWVRACGGR